MAKAAVPDELSEEEIARRCDDVIRRALSTPPKPLKEYVGKSERAIAHRKRRTGKVAEPQPSEMARYR
jgi:hypothetical protein